MWLDKERFGLDVPNLGVELGAVQGQMDRRAAEPQPKAKPFNAEERSKQRKDEESQKLTTEALRHGDTEKKLPSIQTAQQKFI